jgi:hypothetical protein
VGNDRVNEIIPKTWERKIIRNIYGQIKDKNGWIIRTHDELQVMHRKPNIVTTIKVRRLEWAGHVVRMSDDRTVKILFLGKEVEEESRRQICMGYHSEGDTGETIMTVCR